MEAKPSATRRSVSAEENMAKVRGALVALARERGADPPADDTLFEILSFLERIGVDRGAFFLELFPPSTGDPDHDPKPIPGGSRMGG